MIKTSYFICLIFCVIIKLSIMYKDSKTYHYSKKDLRDSDFWLDIFLIIFFPQLIGIMFIFALLLSPREFIKMVRGWYK